MNGLQRLTPVEAKRWIDENKPESVGLTGSWGTTSEEDEETYAEGLENSARSIRNSSIVFLVDDEPMFEINRKLTEVEATHPILAAILKRIDGIRDSIADTLEAMIQSGAWNHKIITGGEQTQMDQVGMRLAQKRVLGEMSTAILEVFSHLETYVYSFFLNSQEEEEIVSQKAYDDAEERIGSVEQEQALISKWIMSTLPRD